MRPDKHGCEMCAADVLNSAGMVTPVRPSTIVMEWGDSPMPRNVAATGGQRGRGWYYRTGGCGGDLVREQEYDLALALARHKLEARGFRYRVADVEYVARAIMLPREAFIRDARELANRIKELRVVHSYAPNHVIVQRLIDLVETRLRLVDTRPVVEDDADDGTTGRRRKKTEPPR